MNLYDVNKQIFSQLPKINNEEIEEAKNNIKNFIMKNYYGNNAHYFMLLNNEKHDYTIFSIISHFPIDTIIEDIFECVNNRGTLKMVETYDDDDTNMNQIGFWIDDKIYYFFPYDNGVIEY